jgi:hypothetical protein
MCSKTGSYLAGRVVPAAATCTHAGAAYFLGVGEGDGLGKVDADGEPDALRDAFPDADADAPAGADVAADGIAVGTVGVGVAAVVAGPLNRHWYVPFFSPTIVTLPPPPSAPPATFTDHVPSVARSATTLRVAAPGLDNVYAAT